MTPQEKAKELIDKMDVAHNIKLRNGTIPVSMYDDQIKQCAIIAVANEYNSLREFLYNLRASGNLTGAAVYNSILQKLIDEEQKIKSEIEKL